MELVVGPEPSACTIGIALTASICRKAPGFVRCLEDFVGSKITQIEWPPGDHTSPASIFLPAFEYREYYRFIVYGYSAPLKRQTRGLPHLCGCPTDACHGVECFPQHMAGNPIHRLCGVRRLRLYRLSFVGQGLGSPGTLCSAVVAAALLLAVALVPSACSRMRAPDGPTSALQPFKHNPDTLVRFNVSYKRHCQLGNTRRLP